MKQPARRADCSSGLLDMSIIIIIIIINPPRNDRPVRLRDEDENGSTHAKRCRDYTTSGLHWATVSALTMTSRLAHPGHELGSATQNARSVSWIDGRGRSFLSAVTCCRRARFSITRSARRLHIARIAPAPRETMMMMMMMMMMRTRSIAAEFALSRSLISSVKPPVRMTRGGA